MKKSFVLISILILVAACEKFSKIEIKTQISEHGSDESHFNGRNCMNCHYTEGQNSEGVYTLAGSMYGNTDNATVELYETTSSAEPFKIIEIDALGNAYTTEEIDFGDGIYVAVRSESGNVSFMEDKLFNGQCNLCHGTNVQEIIEID